MGLNARWTRKVWTVTFSRGIIQIVISKRSYIWAKYCVPISLSESWFAHHLDCVTQSWGQYGDNYAIFWWPMSRGCDAHGSCLEYLRIILGKMTQTGLSRIQRLSTLIYFTMSCEAPIYEWSLLILPWPKQTTTRNGTGILFTRAELEIPGFIIVIDGQEQSAYEMSSSMQILSLFNGDKC